MTNWVDTTISSTTRRNYSRFFPLRSSEDVLGEVDFALQVLVNDPFVISSTTSTAVVLSVDTRY